jgi:hypothetical protein
MASPEKAIARAKYFSPSLNRLIHPGFQGVLPGLQQKKLVFIG